GAELWHVAIEQRRTARLVGNSICVHFGNRQQWFSFRGYLSEHLLVQLDNWRGHVSRSISNDCADAGGRRESGAKEIGSSLSGNISGDDAAIYGVVGQCNSNRRRAYLFSSTKSGSDC